MPPSTWIIAYYLASFANRYRFYIIGSAFMISLLPSLSVLPAQLRFQAFDENLELFEGSTQACQLPVLDPFDQSVLPYVDHPQKLQCKKVQPDFTQILVKNLLLVNKTLLQQYAPVNLKYRLFRRRNGTDDVIDFDEWKLLKNSAFDLDEFADTYAGIWIRGTYKDIGNNFSNENEHVPGLGVYENVHPIFLFKPRLPRSYANKLHPPYSALLFGIDSTSKSNFIRNLPKTYQYLTKILNVHIMNGYAKVADNTFPNSVAFLTGRKAFNKELSGHYQKEYVDHYPFIWKNFSRTGYWTGLLEEQPGIYTYKAKGFQYSPVDYYMRPAGLVMRHNATHVKNVSDLYCFGNIPESMNVLQTLRRIITQAHSFKQPYFLFSFLWKVSHDVASEIEILDNDFAEFFRMLYEDRMLERTLLFVLSDHGNRFDRVRSTLIGRIEERMPFLAMYVPKTLATEYPHILENLSQNTGRLTSPFDVYETLVDILERSYGQTRPTFLDRGQSLLSEVSANRTCAMLSIPYHFCVCQEEEHIQKSNPLVKNAVKFISHYFSNTILAPYSTQCAPLYIAKVLHAQQYRTNKRVTYNSRWHYNMYIQSTNVTDIIIFLRVTFETAPNRGLYEALVQYNPAKDMYQISGQDAISRINAYGHEGDCMSKQKEIEKFCLCR